MIRALLLSLALPLLATAGGPMAWQPRDYTYLWWANGWKDQRPAAPAILCPRPGAYGLALDVERMRLLHFGAIAELTTYPEAAAEGNREVFKLPPAELVLAITIGTSRYSCVRAATNRQDHFAFPVRIIDSGRLVQRCDIQQLEFADAQGRALKAAGRLEIIAWPDSLSLLLDVVAQEEAPSGTLTIAVGDAFARKEIPAFGAGQLQTVALVLRPGGDVARSAGPASITVSNLHAGRPAPTVRDEVERGWVRIHMPPESWSVANDLDRLDRYALRLENPSDQPRVVRLFFDAAQATPGITGLVPMLRDEAGNPSGLPVQISKNWHQEPDRRTLYEGNWVHAFALLRLPPGTTSRLEFAVTYGRWGGVPSASHAQLCLVGWGWNQLWDESALGSWGETICYEPDGIQRRCMIDDVRPLMVWAMSREPKRKFGWTSNVGGGDFLVYYDGEGRYQPMAAMHAAYQAHGPNLTDATYAGVTADGHIAVRIGVSLARSDDLVRGFHRLRYDVLKPTPFRRLAFYQLGSDRYLGHQFGKMARGNETGMIEEWAPKRGGRAYDRTGIPCPGSAPWFSLHEAIPGEHGRPAEGAWANRGLVVRSWKARLGGKEVPPFASVFGTAEGSFGSANLELSAPPDLQELQAGDFVEAEVELVVVPMQAEDYYGPNEGLRAALRSGGNTWKPILREAAGHALHVEATRGRVLHAYPLAVAVDAQQAAEFTVTGGVGYVPITLRGLTRPGGYELLEWRDGKWTRVDQSVHGRDFWQTDVEADGATWSQTYNLPLDTPDDRPLPRRLRFQRSGDPT
jgi:hypothetical protein